MGRKEYSDHMIGVGTTQYIYIEFVIKGNKVPICRVFLELNLWDEHGHVYNGCLFLSGMWW